MGEMLIYLWSQLIQINFPSFLKKIFLCLALLPCIQKTDSIVRKLSKKMEVDGLRREEVAVG